MPDAVEKASTAKDVKKKVSFIGNVEIEQQPPTSYLETLINLFKGNVGTGCFAMADAMRNGGIILGPIITIIIATICIQCMHMLVRGADYIMKVNELSARPDFSEVVELSFLVNKNDKLKKCSIIAKRICNIAICITQLGFCCVYLLFVSKSIKIVLDYYDIVLGLDVIMTIVLIPVWASVMVNKLKQIAIFSGIANVCMLLGCIFTIGYSMIGLPAFSERNYVNFESLPLFFGTALFAFEGIALVLPLQNAMKEPSKFASIFGVLNVGMVFVSFIYVVIGFFGYWRYGEETQGSLTLNLPADEILAQIVILMVGLGVMLGYPIQFFVAIQIMLPSIIKPTRFGREHPLITELLFRSVMVLVTFTIAQLVPNLSLLLSLIGAVFCSILVFIFPAIIELTTTKAQTDNIGALLWIKNSIIVLLAFIAIILGGAESIYEIALDFSKPTVTV